MTSALRTAVDSAKLQRQTVAQIHLERSGERTVHGELHVHDVQMKEDRGISARQNYIKDN